MPAETIIGWDVGGAHLKAARLNHGGRVTGVIQVPCPLWQGLEHLEAALATAIRTLGPAPRHAVTMTGEMVDLFPDRSTGVAAISALLSRHLGSAEVQVYAGVAGFRSLADAGTVAGSIASANWLATAAVAACSIRDGLLLDIGSTTTDLVPIRQGRVEARGADDHGRLAAGELLYTGVVRTSLMSLAEVAPCDGAWVPIMAEHFATTADVYRILGELPQDADLHPTADGGPKTVEASARRLARMVGRDAASASPESWRLLAQWFRRVQVRRIEDGLARLETRPGIAGAPLVVAGTGRFLARHLAERALTEVREWASLVEGGGEVPGVAECAPAVAVAWLLRESGNPGIGESGN
jgi:probable H4MPT-linked C1 transfer pathway protein